MDVKHQLFVACADGDLHAFKKLLDSSYNSPLLRGSTDAVRHIKYVSK